MKLPLVQELQDSTRASSEQQMHRSPNKVFQKLQGRLLCFYLAIIGFVTRYTHKTYLYDIFPDRAWGGITSISLILFEFIKVWSHFYLMKVVKIYNSVLWSFNTVSLMAWGGFNILSYELLEVVVELFNIYIPIFVLRSNTVPRKDVVNNFKRIQIIKWQVL